MNKTSRSKTRTSNKQRRLSFVIVKKATKRLTHWTMGFALLPLLWGAVHQTALLVPSLGQDGYRTWWLYVAGMLTYLVIERLIAKPMWLYVFGHEMTHVVSGVLTGAKIHSFKAKSTGGEVRLSKSNAFIALSPYVFPLYALAVISVYALTRRWWNPPQLLPVFQFVLGLAIAFHISLTISAIHKHQPDLKVLGHFLSGVLIVLGNVLILAVLGISLFSRTPTLSNFAKAVGRDTRQGWEVVIDYAGRATNTALRIAREQQWIR